MLRFYTLPRSHDVLARPVFRSMQQQPGLSAATGPFAEVQLPQPGVDSKFCCVLLSLYLAHALSVPFPFHCFGRGCGCGRGPCHGHGGHEGKCCLIVAFLVQPCSRPACACLSIYPTRTQQQRKLRAGGWRSGHARGTAAGAGGHEGKLCLIVVFVVQLFCFQPFSRRCARPIPRQRSSSASCGPVVCGCSSWGTHEVRPPELEATKVN